MCPDQSFDYNRTDDDNEKIGIPQRKELIDIIYKEAVRLAEKLKSGYDKRNLHIDNLADAVAMKIKAKGFGGFLQTEAEVAATSTSPTTVGVTMLACLKGKRVPQ